jgi:hypothetical protein
MHFFPKKIYFSTTYLVIWIYQGICKGFLCDNHICLDNRKWLCDGKDDCGDNSDEGIQCHNQTTASNCKLEQGLFKCLNGNSCIPLDNVCNGKMDCEDNSDEGIQCQQSNSCVGFPCINGQCRLLPSGPKCICKDGFTLNKSSNICEVTFLKRWKLIVKISYFLYQICSRTLMNVQFLDSANNCAPIQKDHINVSALTDSA